MIIELDTKKILIILIIIVLAIGIAGAAYLLYHPEKEQTLQVKDLNYDDLAGNIKLSERQREELLQSQSKRLKKTAKMIVNLFD